MRPTDRSAVMKMIHNGFTIASLISKFKVLVEDVSRRSIKKETKVIIDTTLFT